MPKVNSKHIFFIAFVKWDDKCQFKEMLINFLIIAKIKVILLRLFSSYQIGYDAAVKITNLIFTDEFF